MKEIEQIEKLKDTLSQLIFLCDNAGDFSNGVVDSGMDEGNVNASKIIEKCKKVLNEK